RAVMQNHFYSLITQIFSNLPCKTSCHFTLMNHINIRTVRCVYSIQISHQRQDSLNSHSETTSRRRLPSYLRNQPIVTTTRANGALRTKTIAYPLEYRTIIVIQPSDKTRVDREIYSTIPQNGL